MPPTAVSLNWDTFHEGRSGLPQDYAQVKSVLITSSLLTLFLRTSNQTPPSFDLCMFCHNQILRIGA